MNIKKHIPNFLTCCNLLCGVIGIIAINYRMSDDLLRRMTFLPENSNLITAPFFIASFCIFTGCIFDFFDGFAARMLKVTSPIGKELDSLADVITFGVLPGLIMFHLMRLANSLEFQLNSGDFKVYSFLFLTILTLLIPVFSALRLAKFNIDTRQTSSFIGLPTPANSILIASLPLITNLNIPKEGSNFYLIKSELDLITQNILNPYLLGATTIILCYLLVAELPLFALKFTNLSWSASKMKYILLASSIVLLILLQWAAIPLIIFLYIILSVIENKVLKPKV